MGFVPFYNCDARQSFSRGSGRFLLPSNKFDLTFIKFSTRCLIIIKPRAPRANSSARNSITNWQKSIRVCVSVFGCVVCLDLANINGQIVCSATNLVAEESVEWSRSCSKSS